jgi:DNA-binding winged helix-turn-helix (wHTH) protein
MDGFAISFGPFRLHAAQRLLLEGDKLVRLGSRAFDILAALVERAGQVVGKEELIARAWPQTFVEESNLKIQVSALRRALGDGQGGHRYIVTVPRRGYNFVAPVSPEEPARAALPPAVASASVHNLPLAVTRMIGRDETVTALALPRRPAQRKAPSGTRARWLRYSRPNVAHYSLSDRPTGGDESFPCAGSMAPGIPGSGDARRPQQRGGRPRS